MRFEKEFIFGAATAAYQAEGAVKEDGRGPVYWDEYYHREGSSFNGDTASDFYNLYSKDLDLAKDHGIQALRISIAWSRIFPDGRGNINEAGIKFYSDLIDSCINRGITPFVTLHHFDTPLSLYKKGDWLNRQNIDYFVDFAEVCFSAFGNRVRHWITINEPWSVVAGQYLIGHFPPNIKYDLLSAIQAMHNMMVAHAKCVLLYKSMSLKGEIGIVHILESKYPITEKQEDKLAAQKEHILCNQFMMDACFKGEYSKDTLEVIKTITDENYRKLHITDEDMRIIEKASMENDFLGLNYYASHFIAEHSEESLIRHNGTGEKGESIYALKGVGKRVINTDIETTKWDWPIYPEGLFDMLRRVHKEYGTIRKIYVTENGLGDKEDYLDKPIVDDDRIDYIRRHLEAILEAKKESVPVMGYFVWSLMDLLSWTNGYNKRYGLFYVDFKTQERSPKKSALWYRNLIEHRIL